MKAIMYHYIRPNKDEFPFFRHLHIDNFIKQLEYFGNEYGFVDKKAFLDCLKTGNKPNGVILTFDDGFSDHFEYVLPELIKRKIWGIFYIPILPLLKNKLLDVHRIHALIGKFGGDVIAEAIESLIDSSMLSHFHIEEFQRATYSRQNNDKNTNYVKRLLNYFIDNKYKEVVIDDLMARFFEFENTLAKDFYMTKDQLKEMSCKGMIIGSHTVNHPVMSKLDHNMQKEEIVNSFNFLDTVIQNNSQRTFCYPYGGFHSFTSQTEKILEENGCKYSFNVEPRDITTEDILNRRQALPRYDCNQFPWGKSV